MGKTEAKSRSGPFHRWRQLPWGGWVGVITALLCVGHCASGDSSNQHAWVGIDDIQLGLDINEIYLVGVRARSVIGVNVQTGLPSKSLTLEGCPTGIAWDRAGRQLVVTTIGDARSALATLDPTSGRITETRAAGRGACSPVVDVSQRKIFVCNRYEDSVSAYDLKSFEEIRRIRVLREPVAAGMSEAFGTLAVANHLPLGAADEPVVAAAVTLIDTRKLEVRGQVILPSGSTTVRGIAVSPSGDRCAVVHGMGRYQIPTTQVEHGWMNVAVLSLIELKEGRLEASILLDEPRRGAANPWDAAWTPDGGTLVVAHAGTHEISVLDVTKLDQSLRTRNKGDLITDLDFLDGVRTRVALPGKGPRSVCISGPRAFVACYFSDSIEVVDLGARRLQTRWTLGAGAESTIEFRGEQLFHDATICRQGWQSCASCHPDGRADGLNWDLLNDGVGNPKNTKSLLLSLSTPPSMSLGVRTTAEQAIRAGLRHILFTVRPEYEAQEIDTYLRGLRPEQSPRRVVGQLSEAAKRGKVLFNSGNVGCASCHPSPLFTDLRLHNVGTGRIRVDANGEFDTPTLVECWRTAPYLHDGSAATVREVVVGRNLRNQHGATTHLTTEDIDALVEYVLSL